MYDEVEYDVYYEGTADKLVAFLYPLCGPNGDIFNHLILQKVSVDADSGRMDFSYYTVDFQNIDKQKETVVYASTTVNSQENYFYSTVLSEQMCMIWRSIDNFLELRPKNKGLILPKQTNEQIELKYLKTETEENTIQE